MVRTLTDLAWPRRTARLLLRPPVLDDMRAVHAYRADEQTARWLGAVATSVEEVAGRLLAGGHGLVVERDGAVVGDLMLRVEDGWAQREVLDRARGVQAELGWVVAPEHCGRGYAVEAVRELVTIALELGVRRVVAQCFADNHASRRLMERVGLRLEGHFRGESLHRDGTWRDSLSYALLAEEWDADARAVCQPPPDVSGREDAGREVSPPSGSG